MWNSKTSHFQASSAAFLCNQLLLLSHSSLHLLVPEEAKEFQEKGLQYVGVQQEVP
jgi:hypothetical protein